MSSHVRRLTRIVGCAGGTLAVAATLATAAPHEPDVAAIVNGTTVSDADFAARWPYIVAVVGARARSQYDGQFCGGSLVDDQHVLTAAHCLTYEPGVVASASGLRVVTGTRTLDRSGMGSGATLARRVVDVFIHPGFAENAGDGFRNDVAILRLAEPVPGAATIRLVQDGEQALWGAGAGGVDAWAAGWGDTDPQDRGEPGSKYPSELQQARVPLRSDAACSSTVGGGYGLAFERDTNLCGGTLQSGGTLGSDACQGDSGGPLVVDAPDGSLRQVGITSWGEGCAQRTFGAYSRIDALRPWIESVPGATDGAPPIGGPGGTLGVANLRGTPLGHRRVVLSWESPNLGAPAERYAVWRSTRIEGDPAEELVAITTGTSLRTRVAATRRRNAYVWNVRPLDAGGSNGPQATIKAGPAPDTVAPSRPRAVVLTTRTRRTVTIRWTASTDPQSGIVGYQVQRFVPGSGVRNVPYGSRTPGRVRIDGLRPGRAVRVRVRAVDAAGNAGAWRWSRMLRTRP